MDERREQLQEMAEESDELLRQTSPNMEQTSPALKHSIDNILQHDVSPSRIDRSGMLSFEFTLLSFLPLGLWL